MLKWRGNLWSVVILLAAVSVVVYVAANWLIVAGWGMPTPMPTRPAPSIMYVVSGSAESASITLSNLSGGTEQIVERLPWRLILDSAESGAFVYVSAQNEARTGMVRCAIYVGSEVVAEAESDAPFGIATCSGVVQ